MKELIKMVVVLTIISACSGVILASVRNGTIETIEKVLLDNEKKPAIESILTANVKNNPIDERFKITDGEKEITIFPGKYDGGKNAVVFESYGNGFEAAIGVMVGVNLDDDKIIGVGVTTHSETPGIGSRAKTETFLSDQFKTLSLMDGFMVKKDGGKIDAIGGATITSQGVCKAITNASDTYKRLKSDIQKGMK